MLNKLKRLLSRKSEDANEPLYRRGDPSQFLIDIESSSDRNEHNLPPALINLIRSVKLVDLEFLFYFFFFF